jgi:DNA-binding Xre family transcriptional regulator
MFINKKAIEGVVEDGVSLLRLHPAFSDVDDETWDDVKEVWRTIMRRNFHRDNQHHNELKLAGIQRAKAKGVFKGRQSRFSEDEFTQMRAEYHDTDMTKAELAAKWGITRSYLYQVCKNKSTKTESSGTLNDDTFSTKEFDVNQIIQIRHEFNDLKNHRNKGTTQLAEKWGISKSYLYILVD